MNATVYLKDIMVEGNVAAGDPRLDIGSLNREGERFISVEKAVIYEYDNDSPLASLATMFINKDAIIYVKPVKDERNE